MPKNASESITIQLQCPRMHYTPIPHRPRIARIATNGIFIASGGIREVSLKQFLQSSCSTSQSRFRYDVVTIIRGNRLNSARIAQEFVTISK